MGLDFYQFFSFNAKKAIYQAAEVAEQYNNQYLEPEHVFYAILKTRNCKGAQALRKLEVDLPKLIYNLEAKLYEHAGSYKGQASFSQRTLILIDSSMKEVKRLHHREIGTMHLLIALAQESEPILKQLFAEHNLDAARIRNTFISHLIDDSNGLERSHDPPLSASEVTALSADPPERKAHYERVLSEASLRALRHGGSLAGALGHAAIEPEHVLFMAIADAQSEVALSLKQHKADAGAIMALLLGHLRAIPAEQSTGAAPLGERLINTLSGSFKLMVQLDREHVRTSHILYATLLDEASPTAAVFKEQGIYDQIVSEGKQTIAEAQARQHAKVMEPQATSIEDAADAASDNGDDLAEPHGQADGQ
jgi:ATP-dependent Clp protease ATP-binding subunit ClpA